MRRYAAHKDTAHGPIVRALCAVGALVEVLDGKDIPDLLVCFRRSIWLLEVKTPDREVLDKRNGKVYLQHGKLSPGQEKWHAIWKAAGAPVDVVETPEDALRVIGAVRVEIREDAGLLNESGWPAHRNLRRW